MLGWATDWSWSYRCNEAVWKLEGHCLSFLAEAFSFLSRLEVESRDPALLRHAMLGECHGF